MIKTSSPKTSKLLIVASLGVVFGDIGTSPLYSLQTLFSEHHHAIAPTHDNVLGIISLVLWIVTLIVTVKYVTLILRADHHGEGGVLALATLTRKSMRRHPRLTRLVMPIGVVGACLFIGDSVITPAISVLSAVEGLTVAQPDLAHFVVPIAVSILIALFVVQRFGTSSIASWFGPIMASWFGVLAVLGILHILKAPEIFAAISPTYAVAFAVANPGKAFLAFGAVVLTVTGAEALYADLGHFGRSPISRAWLWIVFPSLALNYLGQGALLLHSPTAISSPFFLLAPQWLVIPLTVLATIATIIASQSVISGTFSVTKQAIRLGYLPNLEIRNTSEQSYGQIYVPVVNNALLVAVVAIVLTFQSSLALANAYGMAVATTFILDSVLFLMYAHFGKKWPLWHTATLGAVLLSVESTIFAANTSKFIHGGWLPILIALSLVFIMETWHWGTKTVASKRRKAEGSLREFLDETYRTHPLRIPGTAIYTHNAHHSPPLALLKNLRLNGTLHETVIIVRVHTLGVPHIPLSDRVKVQPPSAPIPGILLVDIRYGFFDRINVPLALLGASRRLHHEELNPTKAQFILSNLEFHIAPQPWHQKLRSTVFIGLSSLSSSPTARFHLPEDRTTEIGQWLYI
ncbi:potassium transporter Kup [Corynebacterium sp. H113]|uniref:potassium transporter Kup n=1 Tax=Corynebacterium sp. H113 TaxID=3133419 RepID=UPI0030A9A0C3